MQIHPEIIAASLAAATVAIAPACSNSNSAPAGSATSATLAKADAPPPPPDTVLTTATAPEGMAIAHFAGGCFWGVEYFMEQLDGVSTVESGYMGGTVENPTYDQVIRHGTGHYETVRVVYDPAKVGYERLAREFFEIHDPTQSDGQGPDIGDQYLSVVFYGDEDEKAVVEKLIGVLRGAGFDVKTMLKPAAPFWIAEGYHQDYYAQNGKAPYCHAKVKRFPD